MDSKIRKQLEDAKSCFYAWRLVDAYNIFRRFYDRVPFQPQKEHAEYIGMFARIIAELGKEHELKFYVSELEKWYEKLKSPEIAYPLGVIYSYLPEPRREASRALFERIIANPDAKEYHAKSQMMLADYYTYKRDILACRLMVDSIKEPEDPQLRILLEIWRACIARWEKKYGEALERLSEVLKKVSLDTDWYAYVSARIMLALTYIESGSCDKAQQIVDDVKKLFEGRHFKSIQCQVSALESTLRERVRLSVLSYRSHPEEIIYTYENKSLPLRRDTPAEKLMSLLMTNRFLDKALIVKSLYDRQYVGEQDDKLIYYHIHSLRKRLNAIGLPPEAIASEASGYRLVPDVEGSERSR